MNNLIPVIAASPLRQRLIDDMTLRKFSHETQRNYLRDVGRFATWLRRSPHTATAEDLRQFQIEQQEAGVPAPTMNSIVAALRFFFTNTLDRPDLARKLVRTSHARKIPVVLTLSEVKRLLGATTCLKHQTALSVAYGAGLRVAEVSALKVSDIDSTRMLLRIERGKGGRYRNAILPEGLLPLLRDWWRAGRQLGVMHKDGWLFPGQNATVPISTRQLYRVVVEAAAAADIAKRVSPHTLRHSFATHLLEDGVDSPEAITTDGLRSYGAAMNELGNAAKQEVGRWANNRVENSHLSFRRRERAMLRFRRMKSLQKFASVHANIHNHFSLERHLIDRQTFKERRSAALAEWQTLAS